MSSLETRFMICLFFLVIILLIWLADHLGLFRLIRDILADPFLVPKYFNNGVPDKEILWKLPERDNTVYLTIDDCPSPYTDEIVSVLREFNTPDYPVSASFFLIGHNIKQGRVSRRSSLFREQNRDIVCLENHSQTHPRKFTRLTYDEVDAEIAPMAHPDGFVVEERGGVDETFHCVTRHPPAQYFRPPCGFYNPTIIKAARKHHQRVVLGSVYPLDGSLLPATIFGFTPRWWIWICEQFIIGYMLEYSLLNMLIGRPFFEGDIIIIHARAWAPNVVRWICEYAKAMKWRVSALPRT